jgi:hypothetical protein
MALEHFAQLRPPAIEEVAKAHPDVIEDLRGLSPIVTAATFGSLLTVPELQANCFRIEVMVHLASTPEVTSFAIFFSAICLR